MLDVSHGSLAAAAPHRSPHPRTQVKEPSFNCGQTTLEGKIKKAHGNVVSTSKLLFRPDRCQPKGSPSLVSTDAECICISFMRPC